MTRLILAALEVPFISHSNVTGSGFVEPNSGAMYLYVISLAPRIGDGVGDSEGGLVEGERLGASVGDRVGDEDGSRVGEGVE